MPKKITWADVRDRLMVLQELVEKHIEKEGGDPSMAKKEKKAKQAAKPAPAPPAKGKPGKTKAK